MAERLLVNRDGDGNATVALNRPEVHNAFDPTMARDLTAILRTLAADVGVRAVVLTAVGRNFSAGADIAHMRESARFTRQQNERTARDMARLFQTLHSLRKPTIAAVRGAVRGGGAGLVAACDIAIGASDTTFRLSEVRLGILPAMISPYIVNAIGLRQAQRYFLTGEEIDSATAQRLGLLHEVCDESELGARTGELLGHLFQGGPIAMVAAKQAIRALHGKTITPAVIAATAKTIATVRTTAEAKEGLSAFLDKRKPRWAQPATSPAAPAKR